MAEQQNFTGHSDNDIAIVGMAAHLPGAGSIETYWQNLRNGVNSIRHLDEAALKDAGVPPGLLHHKNYVPYAATLDGFTEFDGEFFGFSPKESAILDPQHREFLETCWEALENAGHMPENFDGPVGVFAGCGIGSYFYFNICSNPDLVDNVGMFLLRHTGNDKDFLSTRVSHILDLRGPSVNVQTACSTSLVATHYAAQALQNGECDMALAGGVTIELPHGQGYMFKEGEILSPDGQCHAFDHRAEGTVFGSGAGVVVLRRLADAIADGDHIWAVLKGTAINNDGADKAGYLAPSVGGQAAAIAEAHAMADVTADTIDYVECHGTGTYLGDPIEVAALTEAFRETTGDSGYCRIGSVKTNIGHLDTAAGVASLIKASLALKHGEIPPSLGYDSPNPAIAFDGSPFVVNDKLSPFTSHRGPRRAGVNSLGVGGTNAHAVLEEPPLRAASDESDWPFQVLCLSAKGKSALDGNAAALSAHLRSTEDPLADIAWTLKEGRRALEKRRVVVAETNGDAADLLDQNDPRRVFTHTAMAAPDVVFMFPGGGAQYAGMARDLYETEPVFADWMDRGLDHLQPKLDYDIRALWLPDSEAATQEADERLQRPSVQLPLIMITEYALAQLWQSWGVAPSHLVGHSMGENTAAALAGVMSFEDCISLVHLRGTLFDTVPAGGMLSVSLPADDLRARLGDDLDMASVNAPGLSVATGPQHALDALQSTLEAEEIDCQRIAIDIAAHSRMLDPILDDFRAFLASIQLNAPQIPIISNRTGQPLSDADATSPDYWTAHLRGTVNFADCITTLSERENRIYLEVGPGNALSSLTKQHDRINPDQVITSLRHPGLDVADDVFFMTALGRIWACGGSFDWGQIWGEARRNRVVLPTYTFQRAHYFIEPGSQQVAEAQTYLSRIDDISDWAWKPVWRKRYAGDASEDAHTWLMFLDDTGLAEATAAQLDAAGHRIVKVRAGDAFARVSDTEYVLAPERGRDGYDSLIRDLVARGHVPDRIAHFWGVTDREAFRPGSSFFHRNIEQGFYSLLFLAQAIADENLPKPLHITTLTTGAARVADEVLHYPEKATIAGPARVIPRELPGVTCATLDVELPRKDITALVDQVVEDLLAEPATTTAARRGEHRFELTHAPAQFDDARLTLKQGATVLITGGFGGIGLTIAADLITRYKANIALLSRTALPPRLEWDRLKRNLAPQDAILRRIEAVEHLESLGGKVIVAEADVCDLGQMRAACERIEQDLGPITGVVHAAGTIDDGPLLTKSTASIEDVFSPKIHGTQVINDLFPDGDLDWLVLFASSSTVTAPAGQVDYVAANEFLNAHAQARTGGKTRVLALNWGIWSEVGMAADAVADRLGDSPEAPRHNADQPLLDTATFDNNGHRLFETSMSTRKWLLDEHRTGDGRALIPGTGYIQLMAEALAAQGETGPFEIRDLYFLRPFFVGNSTPRSLRVRLKRSDEGYSVEIEGAVEQGGRTGYAIGVEATLALAPTDRPDPVDLPTLEARMDGTELAEPGATLLAPQERHLQFGPRWRVLNARAFGKNEGLAALTLPALAKGDGMQLHPGLMDLATGWAMDLIAGYEARHLWVPVSYGRIAVHAPLPDQIYSWVRSVTDNAASHPTATFDVMICDADGNVCVEIEDFSIHRIDSDTGFADPVPPASEIRFDGGDAAQPLSAAEERLVHNLSLGIRPDEGASAFRRALASGASQLVVSSLNLPDLVAQTAASVESAESGQTFDRPELDSDFVAPETDVERTLAGFWEDLLGVTNIGVEDSFFDLGGHSLIAVRLFAMVKKAYRIEFPISVLFEAPTIRKCADLIAAQIGDEVTSGTEEPRSDAPKRRFTHLVPMHDGEGGPKTPFFLVAGMFGNVLNLRHLAHLLGTNRPFYGLQARGLLGDADPHRDIVEAATDYIAEMKQVQPKGPYLIGGFSGGGITAYEIARQLEAAGDTVAIVVMLDTPLPVRRTLSRQDRMLIQWQEFKARGVTYPFVWLRNRIRWEIAKRRAPAQDTSPDHQFHNDAIEAAFYEAVAKYQPQDWDGNLQLFRPPQVGKFPVSNGLWVDDQRAYLLPDNDWTQHAPNITVTEVPGDHDSMVLEPNVRVLSRAMRKAIETAERAARLNQRQKDAAE